MLCKHAVIVIHIFAPRAETAMQTDLYGLIRVK